MKTKKAAATAKTKARKGASKKATTTKGATTAKAEKSPAKKSATVIILLKDKDGKTFGEAEVPRKKFEYLRAQANEEGITVDALLDRWVRERVTHDKALAEIESQAGVDDNLKRIMEETGFPRLEIHALCLRAGVNAMVHSMDYQGGFKAPFVLAEVPEPPPANTLPVWIDRDTVSLCREIADAVEINADEWVEDQVSQQIMDTVTASFVHPGTGRWLLHGMGGDLYDAYRFTPREWEGSAYPKLAALIERERKVAGIPDGMVVEQTPVDTETHDTLRELSEAAGVPLEKYCGEVIMRGMLEDLAKLKGQGKTPPADGDVSLTLRFTADQWQNLEAKARLESPRMNAARFTESIVDVLACDDGCLPLFIPAPVIDRLSKAGDAACIHDFYNGIARHVLGNLVADPDELCKVAGMIRRLGPQEKRELSTLVAKWKREDKAAANKGAAKA